jgi:PAS domain S-box-containing protein
LIEREAGSQTGLGAAISRIYGAGCFRTLEIGSSFVWKWLFLLYFPALIFAAETSSPARINFKQYRPENGLPTAQVRRILQDHTGFMWFATFDGLVRFDSHEFRTYRHDPSDPRSISNSIVWDIVEDRQGNIWVGSDGGLDLWRRETEEFLHFSLDGTASRKSPPVMIRRLLLEEGKCLWIGTTDSGLYRMDFKTRKISSLSDELKNPNAFDNNTILDLYRDSQGIIWIGTRDNGLKRIDPITRQFQVYLHDPQNAQSLGANQVLSIGEDLQGYLWIGTNNGLSRLDRERRLFENYPFVPDDPAALQGNRVEAIVRDPEGRMWFGTDGGGLSRFEPGTRSFVHFQNIRNDGSTILSDTITAICLDRNGDFWIGHVPAGASYANRLNASFQYFRSNSYQPSSLPDDNIHAVLEDSSGELWVGTDKAGLCYYQNSTKKWISYAHNPRNPNSLSANAAMSLCRDSLGNIWIGTWKGGVDRFDPRTRQFRHYRPDPTNKNSLHSAFIFGIVEDLQHQIWIATSGGGLDRYDPSKDQFTHYRHDPANPRSINNNNVYCVKVSRSGEIWAGTQAGLARWNPSGDDWERYQSPGSLSHNLINDMLEDREGNLWVATNGGGLNHLNIRTGKFVSFGVREGLPSAMVRSVLEDQRGMLWIGTAEGLVCFDPYKRHFRVYDKSSGMEILYYNRNACWRRQNGELMFGANQGLIGFDPRMIPNNDFVPPVVITGLEIDSQPDWPGRSGSFLQKSITMTQLLSIPSRIDVISFQFAALNFRSPERNQYLYQLVGFDPTWRKAGVEQRATYTNLNPGTYNFRVKASNNEGIWNEQGTTLELIVVPAWWQTVWFRTGITGFIALIIAVASWILSKRRYHQKLVEAQKEKEHLQKLQKASVALQESEERLNMALEGADMGIWDWNLENGQYVFDRRWAEIAGYSLGDLPTQYRAWKERIHPEDLDATIQNLEKHLSGITPNFEAEYRFRHKDGHWLWVFNKGRVIQRDPAGKALRVSGMHQDISVRKRWEEQQKKLEEQLVQAQKIESVGRLAGGVAHDLNNMLTPILGHCELMSDDLPPGDPRRSSLREISRAAEHSRDLVRQLLAFARRQTLEMKMLDLNQVIQNFEKILRRTLHEDIQMELELAPSLPTIRGDLVQIEQILVNLALNAQDAMPTGGRLIIGTNARQVDYEESRTLDIVGPGHYVVLTVSDTGAGMDRETQNRIFEPFFTTKDFGKGTGLGLATVYGIVKQHDAFIHCYSEQGAGTVFRIYFPVQAEKSVQVLKGDQTIIRSAAAGSETILLVEDQEQVKELCMRFLAKAGYKVLATANGAQALNLVTQHAGPIHLLLTDVVLPDTDGRTLYKHIAAKREGIRVLYMSGYPTNVIAHRGVLDEGMNFIQKPFSSQSLREKIIQVLEKDTVIPSSSPAYPQSEGA